MALTAGTRLGPYEILAPLGKGGMGEVYRAKDTKLDREVAIKVLPASVASDPERLARFEREAKVLASLNHPNIAQIYGLQDNALVMELVAGTTLPCPLPMETALHYAGQIADALEAAHEKGITHRDLKPANIMVTPDGAVKVLDFGLASSPGRERNPSSGPEDSPTLTIAATQAGMIMGTASYMSPEQAAGKVVDKRSDIWSFGVVLFEMLTGNRLFEGETVSHTLADVLRAPVDLSRLPVATPAPAAELVGRCLDRDVKTRLRDIGEARIAIRKCLANPQSRATDSRQVSVHPKSLLWWKAAAGVCALVALVIAWLYFQRPAPPEGNASIFPVDPPAGTAFTTLWASIALSPDGRYLVFALNRPSEESALWLRPLNSLSARQLAGSERGNSPAFSPDGKTLAFIADGNLKWMDIATGAIQKRCDVPPGGATGLAWSRDGVILFSGNDGLYRVAATGGIPAKVTQLDTAHGETLHSQPFFLPDGRRFLYFAQSTDPESRGVYAASLDAGQKPRLIVKTRLKAVYASPHGAHTGKLLWVRDQSLVAQDFDPVSLSLTGEPILVAESVSAEGWGIQQATGRASFWISDSGVLVIRASDAGIEGQPVWRNRQGKQLEDQVPEPKRYNNPILSPDGNRLATSILDITGTAQGIQVFDFSRKLMTQPLADMPKASHPVWSPDGREMAFSSNRTGVLQIFRKNADGSGKEEQLTDGPQEKYATDWNRATRTLLFTQIGPLQVGELWMLSLDGSASKPIPSGPRKPVLLLRGASSGRLSPDGKWLAYSSDDSGVEQVYLAAFPSLGNRWQVTGDGGRSAVWRADGKEILFSRTRGLTTQRHYPSQLVAAEVQASGEEIRTVKTAVLFGLAEGTVWTVSADGQRFLTFEKPSESVKPLIVMQNWWTEWKR